ncbi:hypothetical protein I3760_09G131500, partial [Carya illinoinensis]
EIWKCIVNGPYIPTKVVDGVKVKKEEEKFDREDDRLYTLNLTVKNLLYNVFNGNEFNRIITCTIVKEYEMFKINDDESIYSILTALGKVYSKVEIVRKILNSLPKRCESK